MVWRFGLLGLVLSACSGKCGGEATGDAASTAPSGSGSAQTTSATVDAAPATKACSIAAAELVDKAVRTDAGLTLVMLPDGRLAVGYATAKGEPAAAILDEDSKPTTLVVRADTLPPAPAKPGTRVFQRVTPLGFADAGLDMHVALDVLDVKDDKSQSMRCGPADDKPLAASDADAKIKDCRSFSDGSKSFATVSSVDGENVRWLLTGSDDPLYEAKYATDKLAQPGGRYLYQVPVAAFSSSGAVFAAREDGGLVLARRDASFAAFGKSARWWHGAAITMPAVALHDHDAVVMFSLQGQHDLYGSTFLIEAKDVPRPEKIALDDPSPVEGDRSSVSVAYSQKGNLVVGFADGKPRHGRVAVLDKSLKTLVAPAEVAADVSELRVVTFPSGKALVVWIGTHAGLQALQSAPLTCPE
jgi:hypothetical protein